MYKKLELVLISILFFLSIPSSVYAKVYINEFSSFTTDNDWLELYNNDSTELELQNYCIRDDSNTNKLSLSGTLAGEKFITFDWGNKLNKSEDTIKLYLNCDETQPPIDQVAYGSSDKNITAPGEGQTAGRRTDGSDEWVIFTQATSGNPNTAPPVPTSTPTPTQEPTPAKIPNPTKIPTPTKTPTPTPTPKTPTPTKTPTPIKSAPTSTPSKITAPPRAKVTGRRLPTSILGIKTKASSRTPAPQKPKPATLIQAGTDSKFPFLTVSITAALLFFACGILFFLKIKKGNQ